MGPRRRDGERACDRTSGLYRRRLGEGMEAQGPERFRAGAWVICAGRSQDSNRGSQSRESQT